jgi:pimeloyl-ACP methyl ester carboxylesterase
VRNASLPQSGYSRLRSILLAGALLSACAPRGPELRIEATPPAILLPTARAGITDGRGRFREIYCAVRADHGAQMRFDRPCDTSAALWQLPGEPPPSGSGVALGRSIAGLTVIMVPGLLAECLAAQSTVFADARTNLEAQGYRTGYIQTRGRQASEVNADIIRDAIRAMPINTRIVLVTHSKGTVDSLLALATYPDLADSVVALVSVAGAVNGSPLADIVPDWIARLVEQISLPECPQGHGVEAVDSLRRSARLSWLATHGWPARVRTYSLVAVAGPDNMSAVLRPFYGILARTEPANDGQVIASDAIIPGSTLLGYANADHLAVAMPFGENTPLLTATLMTRNDYPRAVLLEAAIRFVDEDLRGAANRTD